METRQTSGITRFMFSLHLAIPSVSSYRTTSIRRACHAAAASDGHYGATMTFDIAATFRSGLPAPGAKWTGNLPYSFVGGHNDGASVPFGGLTEAASAVMMREGPNLATYNLGGSPQGYLPLREFVSASLGARASMPTDPDQVLVTSGSLQALDLVYSLFLQRGDVVVVEEATYGGTLSGLAARGVEVRGVALDEDGIRPDHLEGLLDELALAGTPPKFIYTIPTVQNPTGSVTSVERRLALLELARHHPKTPLDGLDTAATRMRADPVQALLAHQ